MSDVVFFIIFVKKLTAFLGFAKKNLFLENSFILFADHIVHKSRLVPRLACPRPLWRSQRTKTKTMKRTLRIAVKHHLYVPTSRTRNHKTGGRQRVEMWTNGGPSRKLNGCKCTSFWAGFYKKLHPNVSGGNSPLIGCRNHAVYACVSFTWLLVKKLPFSMNSFHFWFFDE